MKTYICNWGISTILITAISLFIILYIIAKIIRSIKYVKSNKKSYSLIGFILLTLCFLSVFIPLVFMPISISFDSNFMTINQISGKINIEIQDIKEIRKYTKKEYRKSERKFASGGFWGYIGNFQSDNIGSFQMYVTNLDEMVLVKTQNIIYIVSCKNSHTLIKSLNPLPSI